MLSDERYRPPWLFARIIRVPEARMIRAGEPPEMGSVDHEIVEIHAGPSAPYPVPPGGREFQRAIEDEWLRREWRRAWGE